MTDPISLHAEAEAQIASLEALATRRLRGTNLEMLEVDAAIEGGCICLIALRREVRALPAEQRGGPEATELRQIIARLAESILAVRTLCGRAPSGTGYGFVIGGDVRDRS